MKVEVLYFAQIKEALGRATESIELEDNGTVADLSRLLTSREEWAHIAPLPLSYAVNETFVTEDHALRDGDRVALLTPVSGG